MSNVNVSIQRLTVAEFALLTPRLVDLYIEAMGYSPRIHSSRVRSWKNDLLRPGFTCIIASTADDIVGVAYGFLGGPENWWDRQLRRGMQEQGTSAAVREAVNSGYFEVAELHVSPFLQGNGLGRKLIQELLLNVSAPIALLSTPEVEGEENRAFGLYRSLGFTDVLRHYLYPGDDRPFAVLGRDLPLT